MRGQDGMAAAVDEPEHIVIDDLVAKANATGAKNTAFVVEGHTRADLDVLGLLDLVFEKARGLVAVFHAEFLEAAFAGLIADRAIQWMIDEQKFHHPAPAFL